MTATGISRRCWDPRWICLKRPRPCTRYWGPEFARVYAIVKRAEYEEFLHVISPWEREHLLMNV